MRYLEILKKFDNAIVSESKKLNDIYNKLCNEEICKDCGNEASNCTCNTESNEDRAMCQFSENNEESEDQGSNDGIVDDNPEPSQEDKNTDDKVGNPSQNRGGEKRMISAAEFFNVLDGKTSNEEPQKKPNTEPIADQQNEATEEALMKMDASSLFEDDEEISKTQDGSSSNTNKQEQTGTQTEETPSDDGQTNQVSESNDENTKTLSDWLKEDEDEGIKEPEQKEEPKEPEEDEDDEEEPSVRQSVRPSVRTEEPEEDEEEYEEKQLQESIRNISAFVNANKRLFVGD